MWRFVRVQRHHLLLMTAVSFPLNVHRWASGASSIGNVLNLEGDERKSFYALKFECLDLLLWPKVTK